MIKLSVYYKDFKAGILTKEDENAFIFEYLEAYLQRPEARQISVNLPLQKQAYRAEALFPFFDNLIAEGWLLDAQSTALKIERSDRFGLIAKCGLECIGAVSLKGEDE